jgi:hypothetical protein
VLWGRPPPVGGDRTARVVRVVPQLPHGPHHRHPDCTVAPCSSEQAIKRLSWDRSRRVGSDNGHPLVSLRRQELRSGQAFRPRGGHINRKQGPVKPRDDRLV